MRLPRLIEKIEQFLRNRPKQAIRAQERLAKVLREHLDEITERVLEAMKEDPDLTSLSLSDSERLDMIDASTTGPSYPIMPAASTCEPNFVSSSPLSRKIGISVPRAVVVRIAPIKR